MNSILLIIVVFHFIYSGDVKIKNRCSEKVVKVILKEGRPVSEIDTLMYFFEKISSKQTTELYFSQYVDAFPSTFQSFQDYFGFDDNKGEMPLYKEANAYIDKLFLASKTCCKHEVFNKVLNIAQQGKWDADAVNYLKYKIHHVIDNDPVDLFKILSKREQQEQIRFWYFYFDSPHPDKEISQKLLREVKKNEVDIDALKQGFNQVLKQGTD